MAECQCESCSHTNSTQLCLVSCRLPTMWPFKGRNKTDKLQAKHEAAESNGLETKAEQKESGKKDKKSNKKSVSKPGKAGNDNNNVSILNLSEQLNVAEEAQAQLSQDLQRVTQEKLEMQNQVASLNMELESLKNKAETVSREKWEVSQANTDLQQRLQQTVALARMQVSQVIIMTLQHCSTAVENITLDRTFLSL